MKIETDFEKRFIGVHELARILDVDAESIYAKTSKKNRAHLNVEIPPWIKQGRLIKWWLPDVYAWINERRKEAGLTNDGSSRQ
jgi:predicted DNA-binding transcriptional regulator AlpA